MVAVAITAVAITGVLTLGRRVVYHGFGKEAAITPSLPEH